MQYARHLDELTEVHSSPNLAVEVSEAIPAIVEILLKATNHNFQHYKIGTLSRRIQRRMQVRKIRSVSDYVKHLENHEEEAQALFRELLIGVTAFFRDPEAFEVLAQTVLPKIFENRSDGDTVRIWIAGCANGAEAYSVAILCCETMANLNVHPEVQIFATDIDERALQIARAGIYPVGIEEHVSAERLQHFFVKRGKRYQVTKEIHDLVLFSSHNLISDPPFSRQDLICCRNLLIYLGSHLQNKLIPLFHYALRPSGYLFLGPSENITSHGELFRPLDARLRISQRKGTAIGSSTSINLRQSQLAPSNSSSLSSQPDTPVDLTAMRQRIVLDEFSPKSCVIDENGQILNAAANMQKYLALGDGDFQNNITRLAATGLRIGLRAAIAEAKKTCRMVQHENLSIRVNGTTQPVMVTVQPMPKLGAQESLFLIVFHDVGLPIDRDDSALPEQLHAHDADSIIARLERELETTRSDLDRTLQDMEAANEELKSSNEELLSMNEELQSANEELETSKEEIRAGSDALAVAISDLENLLRSTQIATVFLDDQLRIRSFTPAITDIYGLIPTDIGRSLERFVPFVDDMPSLPDPKELTLHGSIEHKVYAHNGETYLRRVLPYRSHTGSSEGMVCTFTNVTDLTESEELFQLLVDTSAQIVWVATAEGKIVDDSPSWREFTGQTFDEWKDSGWVNAIHPDDRESITIAWQQAVETLEPLNFEYRLWHRSGGYRWTHVRAVPQLSVDRHVKCWIGMNSDISERKHAHLELEARERQLQTIANAIPPMIAFIDQEERYAFVNAAFAKQFGQSIDDVIGKRVRDILGEETFAAVSPHLRDGLAGKPATFELSLHAPVSPASDAEEWNSVESEILFKSVTYVPEIDENGQIEGVHVVISDITDRKRRELDLIFRAGLLELCSPLATVEEIAELATRKVAEHFNADRCLLAEVDLSENVALVKYEFRATDDLPRSIGRQVLDQYLMPEESLATRDGQRLQIEDVRLEGRLPHQIAGFEALNIRSFANGRYILDERTRWTLTVVKSTPYRWKDSEIEFLDDLATAIYLRLDRAKTEADLHASEDFSRTVLSSSPDCVKVLDSDGRLLMMNEPGLALMEIDDFGPLLGKEWWSLWPEEHQSQVRNSLAECREHGECRFELFRSTVKGTPKWWDVVVRPIISSDGRPIRYVTVSRDITEQRAKSMELAAAKSKLDLSLEVSNMSPWSWDVKNNVPIIDPVSKKYYGLPEDKSLTVQDVLNQIDESHRDRVSSAIQHALEVASEYDEEYPVWLPSGKKRWVRARGQSIWNDDGTFGDFFGVVVDITDRKEHELDLTDREAHLRRVINHQLGLVGVIDRQGILVEVDDHSLEIARVSRTDVVGKHFAEAPWWTYDPAVEQQIRNAMEHAFAGEVVRYDVSLYSHCEDGVVIDFMIAPVKNENGEVEFLISSGVDIRERKKAERDLEHRARLAELHTTLAIELTRGESLAATLHAACTRFVVTLDVILVRIWLWDEAESALTMAASAGVSMHSDQVTTDIPFGEFQAGWIVRDRAPILSNEVANDTRISDRELAISEGVTSFAGYPLMIAGQTVGVLEVFSQRPFSTTEFEQLQPMSVAVAQCIERLKYAAMLAENSLRFKMALRAGGMAAWEWRDDRSIWTDELYDLLGVSKDQKACPELFFSLVHPDDVEHLTSAWHASVDGSQQYNTEFRIIRPDGRIRWLAGIGDSVRDTNGTVVRMYGVNWDSTADHDREAALIQSERRANAANAAKSAFVANMSHEIRTPMTAILGYADLVRDLIDHPEALSHLQTIRRNGDYLLDIINDILDLSKIEAGKLDLHPDRMGPQQVVEDVRSIMEVRSAGKNLQLIVEYASQIPTRIYTDSRRLKQILINLVGNAIKFTSSGEVRIVIRYINEDHVDGHAADLADEGGFLQFDVIDTGIGMSDEQIQNLFNPFSQGDSSVSRNFGGTGLGLAISQRLAELLGGGITVESWINQGSKFTATIATGDLTGVPFIDPKPVILKATTNDSNESIRLTCHILVVDDRRDIRFLSRRLLTNAGATVDECEDGQQAVDYMKERHSSKAFPALILLDMQMPNLDGYQTAQQLRKLGYTGPIIALTADAMQGDMNLCREAGCNDYLAKPIDVQLLLEMVYQMTAAN
ncbi:MAG TPA: PAS domain S-box protein [Planctomycetaceae bacterium]|nr:PAS domain S-box protein [Planctomycetaceae bacterium]